MHLRILAPECTEHLISSGSLGHSGRIAAVALFICGRCEKHTQHFHWQSIAYKHLCHHFSKCTPCYFYLKSSAAFYASIRFLLYLAPHFSLSAVESVRLYVYSHVPMCSSGDTNEHTRCTKRHQGDVLLQKSTHSFTERCARWIYWCDASHQTSKEGTEKKISVCQLRKDYHHV